MPIDDKNTVLEVRVKENAESIKEIKKFVFGNGDSGMGENIRTLVREIEEVKFMLTTHVKLDAKTQKEKRSKREKFLEKALIAIIVAFFTSAGSALAFVIKIYPALIKLAETQ